MKGAGVFLRFLQWFLRAIQFCCAAIVLGIFAYFLAALHNHGMHINQWPRAVTGIAGAGVIYTAIALLLLCCLAGFAFTSLIAIILDILFIAAFIYVAVSNRGAAGSCNGHVNTVFGSGDASQHVTDNGHGGFTSLPSFRQACRLQKAVLAVSIVAAIFFLLSIFVEMALMRHRRKEKRYGPSPANDYTSGSGKKRGGLFGLGRRKHDHAGEAGYQDPNALPRHTAPGDVRDSYATEQTRVGHSRGTDTVGNANKYNKYGESGYDQPTGGLATNGYHGNNELPAQNTAVPQTQYPPGNYQYGDGVYNTRV